MDSQTFLTSFKPQIKCKASSTQKIMLIFLCSLLVPFFIGLYHFSYFVLINAIASIVTCFIAEFCFNLITKNKTYNDLSCLVTGLIFVLILPPSVPIFVTILGALFAIIIGKMVFGGIGKNIVNPAAAGRVFVGLAFPQLIYGNVFISSNLISSATPLPSINNGTFEGNLLDLFLGFKGGSVGEICVLAILVVGVFLSLIKIIDWLIPTMVILGAALMALFFAPIGMVLPHLLSGGLMFGAVFMATDYATSPRSLLGKIIFGLGIGILAMVVRLFGSYPEGVIMAILLMNLFVPFLNRLDFKKSFGEKQTKTKKPAMHKMQIAAEAPSEVLLKSKKGLQASDDTLVETKRPEEKKTKRFEEKKTNILKRITKQSKLSLKEKQNASQTASGVLKTAAKGAKKVVQNER